MIINQFQIKLNLLLILIQLFYEKEKKLKT